MVGRRRRGRRRGTCPGTCRARARRARAYLIDPIGAISTLSAVRTLLGRRSIQRRGGRRAEMIRGVSSAWYTIAGGATVPETTSRPPVPPDKVRCLRVDANHRLAVWRNVAIAVWHGEVTHDAAE